MRLYAGTGIDNEIRDIDKMWMGDTVSIKNTPDEKNIVIGTVVNKPDEDGYALVRGLMNYWYKITKTKDGVEFVRIDVSIFRNAIRMSPGQIKDFT